MSSVGTPTPMPLGPDENPNQWIVDAVRRVQGPALALLAFGMFSVFVSLLFLIIYIASPDTMFRPVYDYLAEGQKERPAQERLPPYQNWLKDLQFRSVVGSILGLAGGFIIVIGGMKMRSVSSWGWALAGALMAAIPLTNTCCCLGLPIGVWAILALFGQDVRLAFSRVAEMGGLEHFDPTVPPPPPSRYGEGPP
jgi:hypothetical protein